MKELFASYVLMPAAWVLIILGYAVLFSKDKKGIIKEILYWVAILIAVILVISSFFLVMLMKTIEG